MRAAPSQAVTVKAALAAQFRPVVQAPTATASILPMAVRTPWNGPARKSASGSFPGAVNPATSTPPTQIPATGAIQLEALPEALVAILTPISRTTTSSSTPLSAATGRATFGLPTALALHWLPAARLMSRTTPTHSKTRTGPSTISKSTRKTASIRTPCRSLLLPRNHRPPLLSPPPRLSLPSPRRLPLLS